MPEASGWVDQVGSVEWEEAGSSCSRFEQAMVSALESVDPELLEDEARAWDRMTDEPLDAYASFRIFRDLNPLQRKLTKVAQDANISERQARVLAAKWDWRDRVAQWDDECHRIEDVERLESIRQMHKLHRSAGRLAISKAMQALQLLEPNEITPGTVARLLELGTKLERMTLLTSVEEMQGFEEEDEEAEDAWERIARELDPSNVTPDVDDDD